MHHRSSSLRTQRAAVAALACAIFTFDTPVLAAPTLWAVDATHRVEQGEAPESANRIWSTTRTEIRLRALRGESEGFHLVVTAIHDALIGIEIEATELIGSTGVITIDRIHLYREADFFITEISNVEGHPRLGKTGPVRDALIPFVDPYGSGQEIGIPFDVAADTNQPIWVLIEVPRNTAAGTYTGTLSLKRNSDGAMLTAVTLTLDVATEALPERPFFQAFFNLDTELLSKLHGNATGAKLVTIQRNALEELSRRRISPGYEYPILPSYNNATGFDWTLAESEWSWWLDTRQSATFNLPPIWDDVAGQYRIQTAGGQPYTSADLTPGSHFDLQARLYHSRLWDDLTSRGWLERAIVYLEEDDQGKLSDEPFTEGAGTYDRIRAWADVLHHPDPTDPTKRFRFLVAGDSIFPSAPWADLRGAVDVWDQFMDEADLNGSVYASRFTSFAEEQLWLVPNSYGDFIDYPAVYHRALGFFAWKTGATGLEHWSSIAWLDAAGNPASPWTPTNLVPIWGWGAGAELWPGFDIEGRGISIDGPLPSLRLELNRQAFEDYDLLHLLADAGHGELATALATAAVPGTLWHGLDIDRDQYLRSRSAALTALAAAPLTTTTITGTVRDPSGVPIAAALVGNGTFAAITASDGTYNLSVPSGAITLNATSLRYQPATVSLVAGAVGADFSLTLLATSVTRISNSFETAIDLWEGEGASVEISTSHVTDGISSMRVVFQDASVEALIAPPDTIIPSDWSSFDAFEMDVYNASPWLTELEVDIFDSVGGQSIELFHLNPGKTRRVRLPIAAMTSDPSDIAWMEIYADSSGRGNREIFFDHFRLVRVTGSDGSAPGAPSGLSAVGGGDVTAGPWIDLAWQAPGADADGGDLTGVKRYEILRGVPGKTPTLLLNPHQVVTETVYRDLELAAGTTWAYVVRAIDFAANTGAASMSVEATASGLAIPNPTRGLFWDRSKNGHGFDLQRSGNNWFLLMYTYRDDNTPLWYLAVGSITNGVFSAMATQFDYDATRMQKAQVVPGTGGPMSIDFNQSSVAVASACNDGTDRSSATQLGVFVFDLDGAVGEWCVEPFQFGVGTAVTDFTGSWYNSSDPGWGVTIYTRQSQTEGGTDLAVVLYYYDADGQPRWALGALLNADLNTEVSVDMSQFTGFCLTCTPVPLIAVHSGTVRLVLTTPSTSLGAGNRANINVDFLGAPGGQWLRMDTGIQQLSDLPD